MINDEIKKALSSGCSVKYGGIEYLCVREIVYRRQANKVIVSAGLLDRFENCIVYAPMKKVEAIDHDG